MFYCAAAGAIFALTEMITFALDMFPGRGCCSFSLLLPLIDTVFPRPQG